MPKMKTKSGAAKRFRVRGSGIDQARQAFKRHILTKKTTKTQAPAARRSAGRTRPTRAPCARCCPTR